MTDLEKYQQLQSQLQTMRVKFGPNHPQILEIEQLLQRAATGLGITPASQPISINQQRRQALTAQIRHNNATRAMVP